MRAHIAGDGDDDRMEREEEEENEQDQVSITVNNTTHSKVITTNIFIRLKEVFLAFLPIGFIAFGGPQAHIAILQQNFVHARQWITNEQFVELFALGQSLPGPTSTQIAIAIGTLHAGYLGGIVAFIMFGLPSLLILTIFGCVMFYGFGNGNSQVQMPDWVTWMQHGLSCCAISLVCSAAWKLSQKIDKTYTRLLLVFGAGATIVYKTAWFLPLLLCLGGCYSLIHIRLSAMISNRLKLETEKQYTWKERFWMSVKLLKTIRSPHHRNSPTEVHHSKEDVESEKEPDMIQLVEDENENNLSDERELQEDEAQKVSESFHILLPFKPVSGLVILLSFIVLLASAIVMRRFVNWKPFVLFEGFLRMGSIIVGGGQVILPMIMIEFTERSTYMTKEQFMNGFAIASALPGPLFNFSAYLGV